MVTKVNNPSYNITLTEDEVYTLQILLGFVACDQECNSISEKLEEVSGECVDLEDYERVSFSVENMDTGVVIGKMASDYDEATVVIRFN